MFLDGSSNLKYAGNVCQKTGLKVKVTTTGGAGASVESSDFDVKVKNYNCSQHFILPSLNPSFLEVTSFANNSLGKTFIQGSGFGSSDSANCPVKSVELVNFDETPYNGSCVVIDKASNNVNFNGQFCLEASLKVKLTL